MICDLQYETSPSPMPEYKLMWPLIVALRSLKLPCPVTERDPSYKIAYKCHQWLFSNVVKISEMRDWLVDDIYKGDHQVKLATEHLADNTLSFIIFLDDFQFSKLKMEVSCG